MGPARFHCATLLKFEDLVRQLRVAGSNLEESDVCAALSLTLPESFDPLMTALENLPENELTYELMKTRLLSDESKRLDRIHSNEEKPTAFAGDQRKKQGGEKFNGKCHGCGKRGHMKKDCRKKTNAHVATEPRSVVYMAGGRADECEGKQQCGKKVEFLLDSGASDHMVNTKQHFSSVEVLKQPVHIDVAKSGESLVAKESGVVSGMSNRGVMMHAKDVLYVPSLRDNLMSVKKLTKAGVEVIFNERYVTLKKDGETIGTAHMRGNLYVMEIAVQRANASLAEADSADLWHRRLGHISETGMAALMREKLVLGVSFKPEKIKFCDVCVLGKQSRDPFNGARDRATRPLERIHSDVCGPIEPASWEGHRYLVSFIDDYSHFAVVYLIRKKSEVFEKFKEFEAMATAACGTKISKLTIDQGREYFSNSQKTYYKEKGIQVEPTVAYSPQQNGVAERFNRTLIEKVRTMLIQSHAPKIVLV
ncbi:hypothetical protein RP20_CCG025350 [Aedes albopictus]|nr:hypothetical protein RP20_CCG025350 [Aedes albopictus]